MKRGPGRPRMKVPRTKCVTVFFKPGEYRSVRSAAKKAGVKRMGSFIRQMILAGLRKKEETDG